MKLLHHVKARIPARFRPIGYLVDLVRQRTGSRVAAGPFQGMHYIDSSHGSCYLPKLLGFYERELHESIEQMIASDPDLVVDVGAAEGYYAVGLALRLPTVRTIAFEMEERGRALLWQMASLNRVTEQLTVRGKCEARDLQNVLTMGSRPLVICDTEGFENVLLDPEQVPLLSTAMILVELHDFLEPGTCERLTSRFTASHIVERIWQDPRHWEDFPFANRLTRMLPRYYREFPLSEWRPVRMSWLFMVPRGSTCETPG